MGRIYEALRRSTGAREIAPTSSLTSDGDLFVSPWRFPRAPEAPSRPRLPSAAADLLAAEQTGVVYPDWTTRLAVSVNGDPLLAEQFRFLGASLHRYQAEGTLKRVLVTSASPGDGKTLIALNLSLILSESYRRRVLLIDADLRRPSIPAITKIDKAHGLSEQLKSTTDHKLSLVKLTRTLTLLPAGRPDPDPISTLTSSKMKGILEHAASQFDFVILDTPAVGTVADAGLLAAMADAVLLVVRAGRTRLPVVQRAVEALGRDRILGIVLNGVERSELSTYEHYCVVDGDPQSND